MRLILALTLMILCASNSGLAQPGPRWHTQSKKAIKLYQKAMDISRQAMLPSGDKESARMEVESALLRCLEIDPGFAEAERVLAALRFDGGDFDIAQNHYAHFLEANGADFIRDHFLWAESARHALDPLGMKTAMIAMRSIPGVSEGPDVERIERMVKDAEFMSFALQNPLPLAPEPLPVPVSTESDEYFPSVWLTGDALIFTRKVEDARWGEGQEDLFVTRKNNGAWEIPQPLLGLNTPGNEGAASLSGDGTVLCFTMCREADRLGEGEHKGSCDLYLSTWSEEGWTRPENISAVNTSGWESQPCLSPDGQALYFTRGSGASGRRKYDLFVSKRGADGNWGGAVRLGGTINSSGKEMRPFIHPDGRHFYFATDGRPGMGGMDIFLSTMDDSGNWGDPVNAGWPLNTPNDESGLVVGSDGSTAYFSRDRDGQLDLHVMTLPEEVSADPTAAMEGVLRSASGQLLSGGAVRLVDRISGRPFAWAESGVDGRYHVPVPLDRTFVVITDAPGFMLASASIEQGTISGSFERDFELNPLVRGAEVVLRNVFFESGSAALDVESNAELNRIGEWLKAQPHIRLEVGGHTDDVGSLGANRQLSLERAEAVRLALIASGADEGQLTAKGYGDSKPSMEGTTDEARRQNRRTTLTVID